MYIGCVKFQKKWLGYAAEPCGDPSGVDEEEVVYQVTGAYEPTPSWRILSCERWVRRLKKDGFAVHLAPRLPR